MEKQRAAREEDEAYRRRSLMLMNESLKLLNPPQPAPKVQLRCRQVGAEVYCE